MVSPDQVKNPDGEIVIITYEADGWKGQQVYATSSNPSTTSFLGRFIVKYESGPKPGMKIKVDFNDEGFTKIRIAD